MTAAAPWSFSTNVALRGAARQRLDPGRAAAGEQVEDAAPRSSGSRIANRVCLTRSAIGRVPAPGRAQPDALAPCPAITRPASATARHGAARRARRPQTRAQPAALELAARAASRVRLAAGRVGVEQRLGVRAGAATRQLATCSRSWSDATRSRGRPALDEAEHVALAAQLEVLLGELEPVADLGDRLEPGLGDLVGRVARRGRRTTRPSPRPTRPRSWWSWASPNRSAPSMTIIVASGTSTPTSITVVPTRTSSSPSRKRAISASRSAGLSRPWTIPTRSGASSSAQPDRLGLGRPTSRRRRRRRRSASSISGTTTNVRWPAAASSRTFCHVAVEVVRAADPGPDRDPARGRRPQVRDVEVGVEDLAERPRDRRRGHQQDVRRRGRRPSPRAGRAARPRSGAARR